MKTAIVMMATAAFSAVALQTAPPPPPPPPPPPRSQLPAAPKDQTPQFTKDGRLIRPRGYEEWVMVGASTGLSYAEPQTAPVAGAAPGLFHNIYLQNWAYRYAMERGAFPEGAMLVMKLYQPSRKSKPARVGFYEGDPVPGLEVHLKKAGVDSTGWGFYAFVDTASSAVKIPGAAACYSCHKAEAAFDQAFVQFYPALRERLLGRKDGQ